MAGGFEALGLGPELIRAVTSNLGFLLPTNVQDEAIPYMLGGGDVMVAAETGSGKTAAFGLPLLQIIHEDLRRVQDSKVQRQQKLDPGMRVLQTLCCTSSSRSTTAVVYRTFVHSTDMTPDSYRVDEQYRTDSRKDSWCCIVVGNRYRRNSSCFVSCTARESRVEP